MKFLHAADLHLDSPMRGLEAYEGAPVERLRGATRRALENMVRLAVAEKVDFVVIAGDVYDGDWPDYGTGLFFAARMGELREAGIRVFLVSGNHDAASEITRRLPLPETVYPLSNTRAETILFEECGVAVHGRGFAQRSAPDDLSAGYPEPRAGYFNIGLLHTSADGRPGHDPYAPCTVDGLRARGYDYWALGHVHAHETLWQPDPWIVYPGVLQGRHIRESGPKGCVLVESTPGQPTRVALRPVDAVRWAVCTIEAAAEDDFDALLEKVRQAIRDACETAGGRLLAARVIIKGDAATANDEHLVNAIRAVSTDAASGAAWIERVIVQRLPAGDSAPKGSSVEGAAGDLRKAIAGLSDETPENDALFAEISDLQKKLMAELGRDFADLDFNLQSPALREQLLQDVQRMLLTRLAEESAE